MNSYDKYREELLKISNIPEEKLNEILSNGRGKYDPNTLQALPFEGISVIHNIEKPEAEELHLFQIANHFKHALQENTLNNKVACVSLASFHVTTFDLIHEKKRNILKNQGYEYKDVCPSVEKAAIEFVNEIAPKLSARVTITGIGMFAPRVIKLNLQLNPVVKHVFQTYRRELNHYLNDNVAGYSCIRDKNWKQPLSGHITLGYVVNPMSRDEIETFLHIMKQYNEAFQPIPFTLTQGEVTGFTDMDHYFVIPIAETAGVI